MSDLNVPAEDVAFQPSPIQPEPKEGFFGVVQDTTELMPHLQGIARLSEMLFPSQPDYKPLEEPGLTGYERYAPWLREARSPAEFNAMLSRYKENEARRERVSNNGSLFTDMLVGATDPTNLIPVGGGLGKGLVKGAIWGALVNAGLTAATSALTHAVDPTDASTLKEELFYATIFGGVLGGLAGTVHAVGDYHGTVGRLSREFAIRQAELDGTLNPRLAEDGSLAPRPEPMGTYVARPSDGNEGFTAALGLEKLTGMGGVLNPLKTVVGWAVNSKVRAYQDLALMLGGDYALKLKDNEAGVATPRSAWLEAGQWRAAAADALNGLFQDYSEYLGKPSPMQVAGVGISAQAARLAGFGRKLTGRERADGKMEFDEFLRAVVYAHRADRLEPNLDKMRDKSPEAAAAVMKAAGVVRGFFDKADQAATGAGFIKEPYRLRVQRRLQLFDANEAEIKRLSDLPTRTPVEDAELRRRSETMRPRLAGKVPEREFLQRKYDDLIQSYRDGRAQGLSHAELAPIHQMLSILEEQGIGQRPVQPGGPKGSETPPDTAVNPDQVAPYANANPSGPPAFDLGLVANDAAPHDPAAVMAKAQETGVLRLYRGIGKNLGEAKPGEQVFLTTDPAKAAIYGDVHVVDVPREQWKHLGQGHGGPDEWITDSPEILDHLKPWDPKTEAKAEPTPHEGEPPIPQGYTRLYHGSAEHGRYDGPAWFSTDRTYAENYRPGAELQYVDVPTERINKLADPDNYGQTPDKGFTFNYEFDSSEVGPRKPLKSETPPPHEGVHPVRDEHGFADRSIRELEVERQRTVEEQAKRERLLGNDAELAAYAADKGISVDEMAELLATNHATNAPELAKLEEYLASPEAKARKAQEQQRAGSIKFDEIHDAEIVETPHRDEHGIKAGHELIPANDDRQLGGPETDPHYLPRVWDTEKVRADPAALRAVFDKWADDQGKARLSDDEWTSVVRGILEEKRAPADDPKTRTPIGGFWRQSRKLDIPNEYVADFIEDNAGELIMQYAHRLGPGLEVHKKFGERDAMDAIDAAIIQGLREGHGGATVEDLLAKASEAEQHFQYLRDQTLGDLHKDDILTMGQVAAETAKAYTSTVLLGKVVFSQLPELVRPLMTHGFMRNFQFITDNMIGNLEGFQKAGKDLRGLMGEAIDTVLGLTAQRYFEFGDFGRPGTTAAWRARQRISPFMKFAHGPWYVMNLMGPVTDLTKNYVAVMSSHFLIEDMRRLVAGRAAEKTAQNLAALGIDLDTAGQMLAQPTERSGRLNLANLAGWDDQDLALRFAAAIRGDVNRAITTPSPQTQSAISQGFLHYGDGRRKFALVTLPFQFMGWGLSAAQKISMSALQGRDANALGGIAGLIGAAYLTQWLKTDSASWEKTPVSERLYRAVDQSGALAFAGNLNSMVETASMGQAGVRPAFGMEPGYGDPDAADALGTLGGPAGSRIAAAYKAFTDPDMDGWQRASVFRRAVPTNGLIYTDALWKGLQRSAFDLFGDDPS